MCGHALFDHYRDMVKVLAHLLRGGHHISFCNPVFQILHLSAKQEVVVGVVQLLPTILR